MLSLNIKKGQSFLKNMTIYPTFIVQVIVRLSPEETVTPRPLFDANKFPLITLSTSAELVMVVALPALKLNTLLSVATPEAPETCERVGVTLTVLFTTPAVPVPTSFRSVAAAVPDPFPIAIQLKPFEADVGGLTMLVHMPVVLR